MSCQRSCNSTDWNPGLSSYSLQDNNMLDYRGQIVRTFATTRVQVIKNVCTVASFCSLLLTDVS